MQRCSCSSQLCIGIVCAGHGAGPVDARGGQLQIAGVVISNWGPNMHAQQQKRGGGGGGGGAAGGCGGGRGDAPPPQVTSVGPRRGGGAAGMANRGRGGMHGSGRGGPGAGPMNTRPQVRPSGVTVDL